MYQLTQIHVYWIIDARCKVGAYRLADTSRQLKGLDAFGLGLAQFVLVLTHFGLGLGMCCLGLGLAVCCLGLGLGLVDSGLVNNTA